MKIVFHTVRSVKSKKEVSKNRKTLTTYFQYVNLQLKTVNDLTVYITKNKEDFAECQIQKLQKAGHRCNRWG